jgi:hypothetical protein
LGRLRQEGHELEVNMSYKLSPVSKRKTKAKKRKHFLALSLYHHKSQLLKAMTAGGAVGYLKPLVSETRILSMKKTQQRTSCLKGVNCIPKENIFMKNIEYLSSIFFIETSTQLTKEELKALGSWITSTLSIPPLPLPQPFKHACVSWAVIAGHPTIRVTSKTSIVLGTDAVIFLFLLKYFVYFFLKVLHY